MMQAVHGLLGSLQLLCSSRPLRTEPAGTCAVAQLSVNAAQSVGSQAPTVKSLFLRVFSHLCVNFCGTVFFEFCFMSNFSLLNKRVHI